MADEQMFEKVKAIVVDKLSVKPEQVTRTAHFKNDLGADSLDTVELMLALEDEFDIDIPDEHAEGIATVEEALSYIAARAGKAADPKATA